MKYYIFLLAVLAYLQNHHFLYANNHQLLSNSPLVCFLLFLYDAPFLFNIATNFFSLRSKYTTFVNQIAPICVLFDYQHDLQCGRLESDNGIIVIFRLATMSIHCPLCCFLLWFMWLGNPVHCQIKNGL